MKFTRTTPLFLALMVLLLASLACAALTPKTTTEVPAEPPTLEAAATNAPAENPTATSVPEATATTAPTQGEVVLDEKFPDNGNNWYVGKDADGENKLENGKYSVTLFTFGNYYWYEAPVSVSNVDLTVDTEFTAGAPENMSYGFLCHFKDAKNHYRVKISPDGSYAIDKMINGKLSETNLEGWNYSPAIKTGTGVTNQIRLVCTDNHLTLYANGSLLSDVVDSDLTGGSFALLTSAATNKEGDKNPVSVDFSNLLVRKALPWTRPTGTLVTDNFDDNQNNWSLKNNENATRTIENGQFLINVIKPAITASTYPGLSASEVDFSFDATAQEGTESNVSFGAYCRYINIDNLYLFDVSADGQAQLEKTVGGVTTSISKWSASPAIKTGLGETNHLRVICSGQTLELYVNDQLVISSSDPDLTAGGFALQAGRFKVDDQPVSVAFDNFELVYPEK